MENGRVSFKERDVADLLTMYGVTDEQKRAGMLSLARQANTPGWWSNYSDVLDDWLDTYLGLEAAASVIRTFELQFVHGLFQTEAYARAVTMLGHKATPAEEIDRRVSLRLKRQDLLTSPEPPRGGAAAAGGRPQRDARPAEAPHPGRRAAPGHHSGRPVRQRRSRRREHLLQHPALRRTGAA
jgi:hypothetical protein